ncbi:kinase-like protein [Wilcoxina mikolae CBS 423.85]|nr:kinase-like protein [Wilcoxina mikolae CBS 423.85]
MSSCKSSAQAIMQYRLPLDVIRKVALQLSQAVSQLHEHNVVHDDLHPGNIPFQIPGLSDWSSWQLWWYFSWPSTAAVERLDGNSVGPGVPKYVVRPPDYSRVMNLCFNPVNIKLVDFGESFLASQGCQKRLNTIIHYAAPEILLNEPPMTPALFDIATLFEADLECIDEVLKSMSTRLPGTKLHLPPEYGTYDFDTRRLDRRVEGLKEKGMGEVEEFKKLLAGMLRFEPEEMFTASEVLDNLPAAWRG